MKRQDIMSYKGHRDRMTPGSSEGHHRMGRLSLLTLLLLGTWMTSVLAEGPAGRDLRLFYQQNCVRCHGADGSAVGPDGTKLKGHDLTDERWQQNTGDDEMVHAILNGKFFGRAMPKFKDALSKDEAQRMVTDIIRKSRKGEAIEPESSVPAGE